jgi:hypothetical protein
METNAVVESGSSLTANGRPGTITAYDAAVGARHIASARGLEAVVPVHKPMISAKPEAIAMVRRCDKLISLESPFLM